jgi:hypothetical protein
LRRVANTLDESAQLAEHHALHASNEGALRAAQLELERASRARAAAQRGRELADRMRAPPTQR